GDNEIIKSYITDKDKYLQLFSTKSKINGESSPGYFSIEKIAISAIKKLVSHPYIIICLRNPIYRSYSAYMHKCRDNHETLNLKEILNQDVEHIRLKQN